MSVWLKAAEIVDRKFISTRTRLTKAGWYIGACPSLEIAEGKLGLRIGTHQAAFERVYAPNGKGRSDLWWSHNCADPEARTARVIALCLMDCLERDGQL